MPILEYDRTAAVAYARKWAMLRNPAYYDFQLLGGDCTNFASQCIYAGAGVMNFTPDTGWYYLSLSNRAPAWTGVEFLYHFMMHNRGAGPFAREVPERETLPGDVVQLADRGGDWYHTLVIVSTEPEIPEQSVISRIISGIAKSVLQVAFIHAADPKRSRWSLGHEEGRLYLEKALGDQVKTTSAIAAPGEAYEAMEQAVAGGAQVVFVTAPTLLAEARRLAAAHPGLKVLVCALSVPYGGIRTYYSRIYEGKFITGAIAGALSHGHPIGYIARYPILGTPASINAFALGARMTDPEAKIILKWSCLPGQPVQELLDSHVRALSGHEAAVAEDMRDGLDWSTCLIDEGGAVRPLASVCWDWGQQYEQLIRSIRSGGWESDDPANESAVSYWWGMSSGVVDLRLADTVPTGVRKLAEILQRDIRMSLLNPFDQVITDQEGRIHSPEDHWMNPEALMRMSWLCDNVEGRIPTVDEVLPRSQETTRLLSLQP